MFWHTLPLVVKITDFKIYQGKHVTNHGLCPVCNSSTNHEHNFVKKILKNAGLKVITPSFKKYLKNIILCTKRYECSNDGILKIFEWMSYLDISDIIWDIFLDFS